MKHFTYLPLLVFLGLSVNVNALSTSETLLEEKTITTLSETNSIAGKYDGRLEVTIITSGNSTTTVKNESITIETNETNTLAKFSLHNFMLSEDMAVGNIDITDIPIVQDKDTARLSVEKDIVITDGDDPNTVWIGPDISANGIPISFVAKVSNDGKVYVNINIPFMPGVMDVLVHFTNDMDDNAVTEIGVNEKENMYLYRVDDYSIGIVGAEPSTFYQIFSQTGMLLMEGKLDSGTLNIGNLLSGLYLMKIGDQVMKFIR